MARHVATFLLTCAATGFLVAAIAKGSILLGAPLAVLAVLGVVFAGRFKAPVPAVSVSVPAAAVTHACPKCGGKIDWVAIFQAAWCARCGRVRTAA